MFVYWIDENGKKHPALVTGELYNEKSEPLADGSCHLTVFLPGSIEYKIARLGHDAGCWTDNFGLAPEVNPTEE